MDRYIQPGRSEEEIRSLMRFDHILQKSGTQAETLRAGSEVPSGSRVVAYPGHPPFSHGSKGMSVLNSSFDVLPVANGITALVRNVVEDGSGDSFTTQSPYYGPPSSSSSELSSPPDFVSETSTYGQFTVPSPQEATPKDASPLSPWLTGGLCNDDYQHQDSGCSYILDRSWCAKRAPIAGMLAVKQPSGTWGGNWTEILGPPVVSAACSGYGYATSAQGPVQSTGEPHSPPFRDSSCHTKHFRSPSTNQDTIRYEDGEVLRYGAGESYRPFNNGNRDRERSPPRRVRSPVRARSPIRDRDRDRDLRARTPPVASDSYVPNRSPRRRSRSPDRYRGPDRARDIGGESWRRRDNSRARIRSPVRRISPRRSPRRSPGRFSPGPRRDDRFDRARSPRRDFDIRDRRRSRSPIDRSRQDRARSPLRRSPPPARGGASYRPPPRSRSPDRRDDRYGPGPSFRRPSPMRERESAIASAVTSRSNSRSRNQSPRPISRGYDNRSRPHSPLPRSPAGFSDANSIPVPVRTATPRNQTPLRSPPRARSPPRGPAALRAPPTGPSATRSFTVANGTPAPSRYPATPGGPHSARADVTSPTIPPSGPRGYVPAPRGGGFGPRGGRGSWSGPSSRFAPPPISPATPHSANANPVPTGPRASISGASSPSLLTPKPFNPPTGPAAQGGQRMTMAQNLLAGMPSIVPGGRLDPNSAPLTNGVTKDLEAHHRRLKEEEERLRGELRVKDEKLRAALRMWERLDRESKSYELKSDLSDQSLRKIAGEGAAGAAF